MVVPCPLGLWTCNRCDAELSARSCGGNDPPTDRHLGFSTLGEFLQISHLFVASISEFLPGFASRVFLVQLESWQISSGPRRKTWHEVQGRNHTGRYFEMGLDLQSLPCSGSTNL
ncbi:unnamed protein product [Durusdinium trenchii]|uniref:Uncharacterized protein n=1 Tax=Durusdinium trenchii TaxID=1381693 RepID=A0ABP0S182_9DINO